MNRNLGIGLLIASFSLSSVNAALAGQVIEGAPIIVQPYEVQALNQQMLDRDRQNRDEEIEIKQLIEENNKLTQTTLAHQQDEGLDRVNQTMLSYRDALLSRDRAHIVANGAAWWTSRYGDLVALTEDADNTTVHQDLVSKSDMLAQKYQMLTDLKDEMAALNDKLKGQSVSAVSDRQTVIDGFKNIAQQQQDKIQMLIARLGEMDKKIAHVDEIIAEKERQIVQLKDDLARMQSEAVAKDEMIKEQRDQIDVLQRLSKESPSLSEGKVELPPIVVNSASEQQPAPAANPASGQIIKHQEDQIAILKTRLQELTSRIGNNSPLSDQLTQVQAEISAKDEIIKQQKDQIDALEQQSKVQPEQGQLDLLKSELENKITVLKAQAQELSSKDELIKSQADQIIASSKKFKDQSPLSDSIKEEVMGLRNRVKAQDVDLKAKDGSIRWLNQVLAVSKNKTEYFKLTAQQEHLAMREIQEEMQDIKADFERRFKDYGQFENAIFTFKDQISQLGAQLSQKQGQVDGLTSALNNKNTQLAKMKTDIQAILQTQANKEIYHRNALAQADDRVNLAKQLIGLQQQEAALLDERNDLAVAQNAVFERRTVDLENKIKGLLADHHAQTLDSQDRMQELKNELSQKEQQVDLLNTELKDKIAQEQDQNVLVRQAQDLNGQLQIKEDQINTMKAQIRSGQQSEEEADSLKQQLAALQDKADQLKQQLDGKTAAADKMASLVENYQKKLESSDSAYNKQLGQFLSSRNYQSRMEKQVRDLDLRLQQKEAQVVTIKKQMYDLQESTNAQDRDTQSKDLSLSMMQQKMTDQKTSEYQNKINALQAASVVQVRVIKDLRSELALAREERNGMPSSDEIDFLRTGLKKATMQLKQKDAMLAETKANADEYEKEFKQQSLEFKSLKEQLQNAYDQINRQNEDLKYKNLALVRLKERSAIKEGSLEDQIRVLNRKSGMSGKISVIKVPEYQYVPLSKNDPLEKKLKQALDKIDEQGRVINLLVQKLQAAGQTVNLTR